MTTILIIDDEIDISSVISMYLSNYEYTVLTATSGEEGVEILKNHHVEIVIVDIGLPGMTGIEFVKLVTKIYNIDCIICTGTIDIPEVSEAADFISKPELLQVFLEKIRAIERNRNIKNGF